MNENELKHYGVPGMRWGHRKGGINGNTKSRHQKQYEDENGFNPNRPNGTPLKNQKLINALKGKPTYTSLTGGPNKPPREAKVEYQKPKKPISAVSVSKKTNYGKTVALTVLYSAIGGLAIGAAHASKAGMTGKKSVYNNVLYSIGGAAAGAVSGAIQVGVAKAKAKREQAQ